MQYSQEHLKTTVYAKFGGQTECIMGNSDIENGVLYSSQKPQAVFRFILCFIIYL